MSETFRVLVVDDEELARDALRIRLSAEPDVELLPECSGGREAVERIRAERPDLVFLDVQMPDIDGFEVLDELGAEGPVPLVVFATAYDEYALAAFDHYALDYLLKPFDDERFQRALGRAREALRNRTAREWIARVEAVVAEWRGGGSGTPAGGWGRILVHKRNGRRLLLPISRIHYLEASGNYVRLHLGDGVSHLVRGPLRDIERQLSPVQFARIHRSMMVNLDCVTELVPDANGGYDVVLEDGTRLRLSRSYRDQLLKRWL